MRFRLAQRFTSREALAKSEVFDEVVEVWNGDVFVAAIYGLEDSIKIISKHFPTEPDIKVDRDPPVQVRIRIV